MAYRNNYAADIKLNTSEVAWLTGIPEQTLRVGVQQGKFSFGTAVGRERWVYVWRTNAVFDYVIDNETLSYKNEELKPCLGCTKRHNACHYYCQRYRRSLIIQAIRKRHASRFEQLNRSSFGMLKHTPGGKYAKFDGEEHSDNHMEV